MKRIIITCLSIFLILILSGCSGSNPDQGTTGYTVTYEGNGSDGGAVPSDSNKYEQGQTVTVQNNNGNLVKTGYTFTGWNTASDASGITYTAGQTFSMGSSNLTLYAKWANNIYTVTYNGNGATGGTEPSDTNGYIQGQIVTVQNNIYNLTNTGFTFTGWNTATNGTGATYTSAQTLSMGLNNVTLYAKWDVLTARAWTSITSSADGTKLAGGSWNRNIYTSADSGVTWTGRDDDRYWISIASSTDGSKLAAVVQNGQIYTSTDSGVAWTARYSNKQWSRRPCRETVHKQISA